MYCAPAIQASSDDAALRAQLEALSEAWARGDADGYAALFAPDATYIVFDGTRLNGRAQIAEGHRPLFARWLRGSRLLWGELEIQFPAPDVAIIHSQGAVVKRSQSKPSRGRWSQQTIVAIRDEAAWRLQAFHNTRYRPFAKSWLGKLLKLAS